MQARIATYARFSSDLQRPTSIEDQQRNCLETLKRLGYEVSHCRHFSDFGISGASEKTERRTGLRDLLAAWEAKELDVIAVDEVSRLARGPRELGDIQERVARTGVRLVTANGLDSRDATFGLTFGITSAIASYALEETRHRVTRSMRGQLERGFMIAAPCFGYRLQRIHGADGRPIGTTWKIHEPEAAIVREIFERRTRGASLMAIAEDLNRRSIPTRRPAKGDLRCWRGTMIFQLLGTTIYRGVLVWNGSASLRRIAKRKNRVLNPIPFPRPELRIIDDATWEACNGSRRPWRRGGGASPFAGVVRCGQCDCRLSIKHASKSRLDHLYCTVCLGTARVGGRTGHLGNVSVRALQAALTLAMKDTLGPQAIERFKDRLRARIAGGAQAEIEETHRELDRVVKAQKTLLTLIEGGGADDEELVKRYTLQTARRQSLTAQLSDLERRVTASNTEAIEAQLAIDPKALVERLLDSHERPERVRALLTRLFPRVVYLGKQGWAIAEFEIEIAPGIALAEASGSSIVDAATTKMWFRSMYGRGVGRHWVASRISGPTGDCVPTRRRVPVNELQLDHVKSTPVGET
jgi:site-specific DNA recombinase